MPRYAAMTKAELETELAAVRARYDEMVARGLALNMARGKPSAAQLELSLPLLDALDATADLTAEDGTDCRNYGVLDGIPEAKRLMATLLDDEPENVIVLGNASLTAMYDAMVRYMLFGTQGNGPWSRLPRVRWLCPVPGYDTYSDDVVRRLAAMDAAAPDFRIFWDNAYAVHHFSADAAEQDTVLDIATACREAGNPDRYLKFGSTSKITFPGAGVAAVAASPANVAEIKRHMSAQAIGHDKLNQLRHARFLDEGRRLAAHMARHGELMAPKFDLVCRRLDEELGETGIATWTNPRGGYFVSFEGPEGTARRIVALAKEAGVTMTGAGATWPYGDDPADSNIRIAPSLPPLEELDAAMDVFCCCVKLAALEQLVAA